MTITQIVSTLAVVLALAAPAIAQSGAGVGVGIGIGAVDNDPNVFVFAQNSDADRVQRDAERAQRDAERAQEQAERAAAQAEARAQARGAGKGVGRGSGPFTFIGPVGPFGPAIDPDALYDQARQAIENAQFNLAIRDFDRLLSDKALNKEIEKVKADAAMYWKAYSQSKLDLDKEALQTITELSKQFANSPWVKDAKALAVEIQAANGQPVSAELANDEELKLLALRGVMQADPDKGVPIIEKMLAGGASPRVRERALFVLSQSRATRAREVILNTAKNNSNPDLQVTAIRYLGMMGGDDRDQLAGIYRSATDSSVKRAILQSYFTSGNVERTVDIAKTEKDTDLRRSAIRNLGIMNRRTGGSASAADALVSIYKSDTSSDIRRAVVNALFNQRNAKALVEIARGEKDASMKREIVQKLSVMKEPEAMDYMLELLK
jgi:HEAT repeat protein